MHAQDFELLYRLEEKYWWFAAMRQITDTIAARELARPGLRILDAGCGTGFNLGYYAAEGEREVYGLDLADDALRHVRQRGFRRIAQASITEIPFASGTFDLVFSFEVVTQTPVTMHDAELREMHRVLKPGGHLFIRVPAFMWLWSSHDDELEVRYRYQRDELAKKLAAAGFMVEWSSYANGFLFPIILVRRFLKHAGIGGGTDVKPLPRGLGWLDAIFRNALASEAAWFKSGRRLPFGLSLICYARKAY
ncbi:MAG TPA: class I SAM-dependent methyltransferase [Terriglobia bacterium]|jgi:SAM-dependent methyltransferase